MQPQDRDPMLRSSLLWRLTLPCLGTILAIGLVYSWVWADRYREETLHGLRAAGQQATAVFAEALADPLWEFDAAASRRILAGFEEWDGFVYAEVIDSGGSFARHTAAAAPEGFAPPAIDLWPSVGEWQRDGVVYFVAQIPHEDHGTLGRLVAGFSLDRVAMLGREAKLEAAALAAISFGLLAVLLFWVARSVTEPLRHVTAVIDQVVAGRRGGTLPYTDRPDEVGRLARAVAVFRTRAADLAAAEAAAEANQRIAAMALIDHLTGLANRRALEQRFQALDAAGPASEGSQIAILHIDLDGFKQINDTLGHDAGDMVIRTVAERLDALDTPSEIVARVGGDEFVIVLRAPAVLAAAEDAARAIVAGVQLPVEHQGQHLRVGCSIGIAVHDPSRERLAETLVHADIALYRAKDAGKRQHVVFDESHRIEVVRRKTIADQIMAGLEREEFRPHFLPIVDATSHRIIAAEVLVRWAHPERGLLNPDDFLDIAAELNLVRFIDREVFRSAIAALIEIAGDDVALPRLAINVSAPRLMEPDFLEMMQVVRDIPVDVDVELLESIYLDDPTDQMIWQLDRLRELGAGIHIDDFGTGHASVAGLMRIAPDVVKIDRCFVTPALASPQARDLVAMLVEIARRLDIDVVAEGVETPEHAALMADLGCRYLQGFAFARPMDAAQLRRHLGEAGQSATLPFGPPPRSATP